MVLRGPSPVPGTPRHKPETPRKPRPTRRPQTPSRVIHAHDEHPSRAKLLSDATRSKTKICPGPRSRASDGVGYPRSARESRSRRDRTIADGGITFNVTAPETGGSSATTRSAHRIGNVERLDALDCTAWSQCVKRSTGLPRIEPATLGGDLSRDHHARSALPNLRVRRAGPESGRRAVNGSYPLSVVSVRGTLPASQAATMIGSNSRWPSICFARSTPRTR